MSDKVPGQLTPDDIEGLIVKEEYKRMGKKTTLCLLTLTNGFEVVGHSACVDPELYNHDLGMTMAYRSAFDQIWLVAGYALQCAHSGQTGYRAAPPKGD
jgi:hypothetical protein